MATQKPTTAVSTTKPEKPDDKAVEYVPFGASDKIRLTASMIRQFIAVPTKSGALPSERDAIRFIMLCRGKRANPFEGDCFLIGYDSQNGPSFSMVCGVELFMKRAEQSEYYDGQESGVVIADSENRITERPGALVLKGEKIVGGWARVYRKDKGRPEYKTVSFDTYNTGRSRWEKDPGGMISKVALSQALRGAYPTALGGLYTQEEMQRLTETGFGMIAAQEPIAMPKAIDDAAAQTAQATPQPAPDPAAAPADTRTVQVKLAEVLADAGVSVDDALSFMQTKGLVQDASTIGGYDDLPDSVCEKIAGDSKMLAELTKKFGKSGRKET